MPRIQTTLPPLAEIAREAGDMILGMQADIVAGKDWEEKPDGSPVSPADKAAHDLIIRRLHEKLPGVAVLSEEGSKEEQEAALKASDRIDTDPLDNTSGYIGGRNGFSVNIGRVKDGVPVEGAVYFPALKELYFTRDGKAYLQQADGAPQEIHASSLPLRKPLKITTGYNEQNLDFLGGRSHEIMHHPAQHRTCRVAAGECDMTGLSKGARGGYDSWDIAGPHAILLAAGGDFVTEDGKPMRYEAGSSKLPPHIAGSVDVLKAIGLADPQHFKSSRAVGG